MRDFFHQQYVVDFIIIVYAKFVAIQPNPCYETRLFLGGRLGGPRLTSHDKYSVRWGFSPLLIRFVYTFNTACWWPKFFEGMNIIKNQQVFSPSKTTKFGWSCHYDIQTKQWKVSCTTWSFGFHFFPWNPNDLLFLKPFPPKTKPKLQSKQGAPFGFQVYIYVYICIYIVFLVAKGFLVSNKQKKRGLCWTSRWNSPDFVTIPSRPGCEHPVNFMVVDGFCSPKWWTKRPSQNSDPWDGQKSYLHDPWMVHFYLLRFHAEIKMLSRYLISQLSGRQNGFFWIFLGITLPETDSKFAPGNGWKTIVPFGARRLYVQVCLVLVSGRVYSWILHIILGGFSGHKFQTLGVLENSGTYLDVPGLEVRINGERINGLFHLLTNGVFLGVITYNL